MSSGLRVLDPLVVNHVRTYYFLLLIYPHTLAFNSNTDNSYPCSSTKNHAPSPTADVSRLLNLAKAAADTLDKARPLREVLGSSLPEVKGPRIVSVGLGRDIMDIYEVRYTIAPFVYFRKRTWNTEH